MTISVAELQSVLQDLFVDTAEHFATETGFCQRARKLTGPVFAQCLVFTALQIRPPSVVILLAGVMRRNFSESVMGFLARIRQVG
jgi:hypothetical protein